MSEGEERLFCAKVTVIVKARNKEDAEEKIRKRHLLVDDVYNIEEDRLEHIRDEESRRRLRENLLTELRYIESRGY